MGFYDLRCSISGLSLKGQRCRLVLLRSRRGVFEPVWTAVSGRYNRLGSIDTGQGEAAEVAHLRGAMKNLLAEGRLVSHARPFADGEPLFELFEPNRNRITLDGNELRFTLIHYRVAPGVVDETAALEEVQGWNALGTRELYDRAFEGLEPIAPFSDALDLHFRGGARELLGLRRWHERNGPWRVPSEAGQHFEDDIAGFVKEARQRLAAWPDLSHAIEVAAELDYFM